MMRSASVSKGFPDWANIPCDIFTTHCKQQNAHNSGFDSDCRMAEKEDEDSNGMRCFCTASEEKIMERELPEIQGHRCWGTPYGWLITLGIDLQIRFFNPLSRQSISLPAQPTFNTFNLDHEKLRRIFIRNISLSSNPTSPDCIVMAIFSSRRLLGFAKAGDPAWRTIDINAAHMLEDVTYFRGSFYALHSKGYLIICQDLDGPSPKAVEFAKSPVKGYPIKYLVDLGGELCMIARNINEEYEEGDGVVETKTWIQTEGFEIFKLDMQCRIWEKMLSLGDRSLFLGNCCTFSVLAADYPNCNSNCIYFTDDDSLSWYGTGDYDIGIYNCDNKKVLRLPVSDDHEQGFHSKFSPPLWIHLT
ncbi:hypothetical protein COLO4_24406 [Corchorus olitorius]|uniref:KIB1-4 beta-propeller domain-containing protein n=1 Tax=Corchorus olitorius TaxID=93759 RepID=A0A1R3IAC5_9ROSI|nr:hypothetical protein COLO4_24406 [Corchorus olitorius]